MHAVCDRHLEQLCGSQRNLCANTPSVIVQMCGGDGLQYMPTGLLQRALHDSFDATQNGICAVFTGDIDAVEGLCNCWLCFCGHLEHLGSVFIQHLLPVEWLLLYATFCCDEQVEAPSFAAMPWPMGLYYPNKPFTSRFLFFAAPTSIFCFRGRENLANIRSIAL